MPLTGTSYSRGGQDTIAMRTPASTRAMRLGSTSQGFGLNSNLVATILAWATETVHFLRATIQWCMMLRPGPYFWTVAPKGALPESLLTAITGLGSTRMTPGPI